ncbi:hypothetical protein MRX96_044971 [Rhipicephalus microplus]
MEKRTTQPGVFTVFSRFALVELTSDPVSLSSTPPVSLRKCACPLSLRRSFFTSDVPDAVTNNRTYYVPPRQRASGGMSVALSVGRSAVGLVNRGHRYRKYQRSTGA